jgi:hypothetical protein
MTGKFIFSLFVILMVAFPISLLGYVFNSIIKKITKVFIHEELNSYESMAT